MTDLALKGCTYEPMSAYLSALAILRLVSEQKDSDAKGWWDKLGVFHLDSCLDEEGLVNFFLEEYRPTPIVSPWNKGSGFYDTGKGKCKCIDVILNDRSERLDSYREILKITYEIINHYKINKSNLESLKNDLIKICRDNFSDNAIEWIDASTIITPSGKSVYPPILGTGGNDGNLEFSNNFMSSIQEMFITKFEISKKLLKNAIFDEKTDCLQNISIGQYDPSRTGGFNQGNGIENKDDFKANPWAFIFTFEGAISWAGSVVKSKNLKARENTLLRSPFTVRSVQVGYNSSAENEKSRAEIWAPLWKNPASYKELKSFLSEGRANVGRNIAANSIEFAEAVCSLGVDRGISDFVRYNLLERRGKSYLALPAGVFNVHYKEESSLIRELNPLLSSVDFALRGDNIPASLKSARRKIDEKIYDSLLYGGKTNVKSLISAIGQFEMLVSRSGNTSEPIIRKPITGLSPRWIEFADDGSLEIRIAAAIASIRSTGGVGPIRANLSPVDPKKPYQWSTGRGQYTWDGNSIYARLSFVLARRMMDAEKLGVNQNPLWGEIRLLAEDVNAFIEGRFDESLVENLIFGFSWIDWNKKNDVAELNRSLFEKDKGWNIPVKTSVVSRPYALLKLLFMPDGIKKDDVRVSIKPESSIIPLLRAGRIKDACSIADRRLRTKDFIPVTSSFPDGGNGLQISAALLIPVRDEWRLKKLVLREEQDKN